MPANLSAMVRYKTINDCLYGGKRRYSIQQLVERCANALSFHTGRGETLSERTVREDIRVMRSDTLGFNAPIKQSGGMYYYDDPYYSILTVNFEDSELIHKVIGVLYKVRKQVENPELDQLIEKLTAMSGKSLPLGDTLEDMAEFDVPFGFKTFIHRIPRIPKKIREETENRKIHKWLGSEPSPSGPDPGRQKSTKERLDTILHRADPNRLLQWGDVLKFI